MPSIPCSLPRAALVAVLALPGAMAHADPAADDKRQALVDFIAAYRLAEAWPQATSKIARDSLPRLEETTRARIDADTALRGETRAAAQARVERLLADGRRDLEAALREIDGDELAAYAAFSIYAKLFETAEIREITAFFDSDTGRKLTRLAPAIIVETRREGGADVMPRHFTPDELRQITAFRDSPVGRKLNATAGKVHDDMHDHFIERSEAAVQTVARRLALDAEAGAARPDGIASAPATP